MTEICTFLIGRLMGSLMEGGGYTVCELAGVNVAIISACH